MCAVVEKTLRYRTTTTSSSTVSCLVMLNHEDDSFFEVNTENVQGSTVSLVDKAKTQDNINLKCSEQSKPLKLPLFGKVKHQG